jgi:ADP-ribosylation factor-like protein 6
MDLAHALTPVECMEQLELDKLPGKTWHITYVGGHRLAYWQHEAHVCGIGSASNAITGRGVEEGIAWLAEQFAKAKSRK